MGVSANQVTSATMINITKIRIKNNMTVMISDLLNKHKLYDQIRDKRNIRDMKKVRTKSTLPSKRKRRSIRSMNSTMSIRRK
jgi:hypothetical protein